jgi:hypothetical protein
MDKSAQSPPCQICGSPNTLRLQYGFPTTEAFEAADRGEIALGGCCIDVGSPQWQCRRASVGSEQMMVFDATAPVSLVVPGVKTCVVCRRAATYDGSALELSDP